jgi:hypothetical protein
MNGTILNDEECKIARNMIKEYRDSLIHNHERDLTKKEMQLFVKLGGIND